MTSTPEYQDIVSGVALDYLPGVRGYAVLLAGPGADGAEALAVWTLSALGTATGAWILPLADLDKSRLSAIMNMVRGRCLVGWTTDIATEALDKIEAALPGALVTRLRASALEIPSLLAETREHRALYSEALAAYSATVPAKIAAPLKWPRELPNKGDEALVLSPQYVSTAGPAASAALSLAGALSRAIDYWQETEETRYRRPSLRSLVERQTLPPRWLTRLRDANSSMKG
jgi:Family of unknown function (DUF6218)